MSWTGMLLRIALACVLVFLTYNPTEFSYFHWVREGFETNLPVKVLAGILLVILYIVALRATLRSIGPVGAALVAAFLAALFWVMSDLGMLAVEDPGVLQWLILIGAALILGVGLSWSHVRRRLSGQADVDDVDE